MLLMRKELKVLDKQIYFDAMREKGVNDATTLSAMAVSGEADGTYLIDHEAEIPTWRQRAFNTDETPVGKPYKYNGQVYKLWQQHDSTNQPDWTPESAVSLWDICHTTNSLKAKEYVPPQGSRGLWQVDECCTQNGHVWKNLFADNAYDPATLPERWEDLGTIEEVQGNGE